MKRTKELMVLVVTLFLITGLLSEAREPTAKERANSLYLNAVSALGTVGGLGEFEGPLGQPNPPQNRRQLTVLERKRVLGEVIKGLKEAVKLDPDLTDTYHFLGVAYILSNRPDEAIQALETAISVEPQKESTYVYLCSLLWDKGEFKKALDVANKFSRRFPSKELEGKLLIATTYYRYGDYQDAVRIARKMIEIDEKNIPAHLLIGNSYFLEGNRKGAEKEYGKVLDINPQMKNEIERNKRVLEKKVSGDDRK